MDKQIAYWLKSAAHDLDAAEVLYEQAKYDRCLFLGHWVLEKVLKAYYVKVMTKKAPYTHSLSYLADKTKLQLNELQIKLLEKVNDFHLETRYPDKKFDFYKRCTQKFTYDYFNQIKEFYHWMQKKF